MFNCQVCFSSVGPRIAPVKVITLVRDVEYAFPPDDEGDIKTTAGQEIVQEESLCRSCAGLPPLTVLEPPSFATALAGAKSRWEHARSCNDTRNKKKKDLGDCVICQSNVRWFASLPLGILSRLLSN